MENKKEVLTIMPDTLHTKFTENIFKNKQQIMNLKLIIILSLFAIILITIGTILILNTR